MLLSLAFYLLCLVKRGREKFLSAGRLQGWQGLRESFESSHLGLAPKPAAAKRQFAAQPGPNEP